MNEKKMTDEERIKYLMEDIKDLEARLVEANRVIYLLRSEVKQLVKENYEGKTK